MAWISLLDIIYPIGSLYFSNNNTSPASIIGGSWTKIDDAVIRSSTSVGYIGSDTHVQTEDEMPPHLHPIYFKRRSLSSTAGYAYTMQTSTTTPDGESYAFMPEDNKTGGGRQCRLSSAPTIVLSGIVPHKCSPRGDVRWPLGFHCSMLSTQSVHYILAPVQQVLRKLWEVLGQQSPQELSCAEQVADTPHYLQAVKRALRSQLRKCHRIRITLTHCQDMTYQVLVTRQLVQTITQSMVISGIKTSTKHLQSVKEMRTKTDRHIWQFTSGGVQRNILGGVA